MQPWLIVQHVSHGGLCLRGDLAEVIELLQRSEGSGVLAVQHTHTHVSAVRNAVTKMVAKRYEPEAVTVSAPLKKKFMMRSNATTFLSREIRTVNLLLRAGCVRRLGVRMSLGHMKI